MAVCIIFKSSAIRAQFKLHYSKPPNDIYVFAKKKKKNLKMHCSKLLCTTEFKNILLVVKN